MVTGKRKSRRYTFNNALKKQQVSSEYNVKTLRRISPNSQQQKTTPSPQQIDRMFNINGLREEFSFPSSCFQQKYEEERHKAKAHTPHACFLFLVVVVVTALVMTAWHSLGCSLLRMVSGIMPPAPVIISNCPTDGHKN